MFDFENVPLWIAVAVVSCVFWISLYGTIYGLMFSALASFAVGVLIGYVIRRRRKS